MAKYIYQRYALVTTYSEQFVKNMGRMGNATISAYDSYVLGANGLFVTSGSYATMPSIGERYRAAGTEVELVTHSSGITSGRYLTKMRRSGLDTLGDMYEVITNYSRGAYVDEIIAEDGTYPVNGRSGNYWYVRGEKYAPFPSIKVGDTWKEPTEGYVKIDGVWRPITEAYVKVNNAWKTLV